MKKLNTKSSHQNLLRFAFVFSVASLVFACQKEAVTKPVFFTDTEYKVLAPYDSTTGRPLNMLKDPVPSDMLTFIRTNLPENKDLRKTNPSLLNTNTTTDLQITTRTEVFLTFISTVTIFKNAIAFYTYPTNNPPTTPNDIKTIKYVLPSAGVNTRLAAGDKISIGTFEPGTSIGLVLMKDAWDPATGKLNNKAVHFCYNDALNPEVDPKLKKHVVLLNYEAKNVVLIGFEDIDRTSKQCDHDFNDVVLYASFKK